ncbi:MAG: Immunoglobulin domain-containing protein/Autotransporter-associated beta strand protein, partial [Verrucomicrobia bacterium]
GTLSLLSAGSSASSLQVALGGTATAGAKSGTVVANYASDGTGTSGLSALSSGSQTLTASGKVYRLGSLSLGATVVDLGRVRLGGTSFGGGTLSMGNGGLQDGYSDDLRVTTTAQGPLSVLNGSGTFAAGAGSVLSVNYSGAEMSTPGLKTGTLSFGLVSQGQNGTGLLPVGLGTQTAQVQGIVYNGQGVWNGGTAGSWTDWTNWSVAGGRPGLDGAASIAAGDTASFATGTVQTTITLPGVGTTLNLAALTLGGSGAISLLGGGTLALTGTIGSAYSGALGVAASGGSHSIDASVFLARETAFRISAESSLKVKGIVSAGSAAAVLVKEGNGSLFLEQGLAYLGAAKITAGTLEVGAVDAGRTLVLAPGASANAARVSLESAASLRVSGDQKIASLNGSGAVYLNGGTLTINTLVDSAYAGRVSGSGGSLVKAGNAMLTLSGENTYAGDTWIDAGTLLLSGQSSNAGAVFLAPGATLAGSGSTAATVTVAAGGILSPGSAAAPGKLTLGGLKLSGGVELNFRLSSPLNSDGIVVANPNGLSLSGTNTIKLSLAQTGSLPAVGSYTLLSFNQNNAPTSGLVLSDTKFGLYDASLVWGNNTVSLLLTQGIARNPARTVFAEGEGVSFSLENLSKSGTVQWYRNGQLLQNAVSALLVLPNLSAGDDGEYTARVTQGGQTSVVSAGLVSVVSIASQPLSKSVAEGGSHTFAVGVGGSAPVSYQWLRNGSLVAGGTGASLAVGSVGALSTGTYRVTIQSGTLSVSSASATLQMLPVVTSPLNAILKVGEVFRYQITATHAPDKFGAASLPSGLVLNERTGLISGVPIATGTAAVVLSASNAILPDTSAGSATLQITVLPQAPTINNALNAFAVVGGTFSYQVTTAANDATRFEAAGLPAGLSLNPATGLISGTPTVQTPVAGVTTTIKAYNAGGFGSASVVFVVSPQNPVFTSPLAAQATVGKVFSYQMTAEGASGYLARNLPSGLSFNYQTGVISGVFPVQGDVVLSLEAYNTGGSTAANLAVRIVPEMPVIGGPLAFSAQVGAPFVYNINATNSPTSYAVTGLPAWLSLDPAKGLLSGTPTSAGSVSLGLQATNAGGTGRATLALSVTPQLVAPVLSGVLTLNVPAGMALSYAIQASNSPKTYFAESLPEGLVLNATTGFIAGIPTVPGTYSVTLGAANAAGKGNAVLVLKVLPQVPVLGSGLAATAVVGSAFRFQISATNQPTKYAATALPLGLSLNAATGLVSGTPIAAGSAAVTVTAFNDGGSASAPLSLTVLPPAPLFANVSTALATAGVAFNYQILVSKGAVLRYSAQGLPTGLVLNEATGRISGTTVEIGAKDVLLSATNDSGTTTGYLTLTVAPALPKFIVQPSASILASWGDAPLLTAQAEGIPSPTYQWKLNGAVLVGGGTNASLQLPKSAKVGIERYSVVATNSAGSVESTVAIVDHRAFAASAPTLTVGGASAGGAAVGLFPGQAFVLSANFAATPTQDAAYQWYQNGVLIPGATGPTYGKAAASSADIASYRVEVSLAGVSVQSPERRVEQGTPIVRITPPGAIVAEGGSQTFTASVLNAEFLGSPSIEYVWRRNGLECARGASLNLATIRRLDAGVYDLEVKVAGYGTTNDRALLQVPTLDVLTQPTGATVLEGQALTLSGSVATTGGSLSYVWRRNGIPLVGAQAAGFTGSNTPTLRLPSFAAAQAGVYDFVVSGTVLGQSLSAVSAPAPVNALEAVTLDGKLFDAQARSIRPGQPLGLEVNIAEGTGPYVYQWYRTTNGVDIALEDGLAGSQIINGARSARLIVSSTDKNEALTGSYKVSVANGVYAQANAPLNRWVGGTRAVSSALVIARLMAPPAGLAVRSSLAGPYNIGSSVTLSVAGLEASGDFRFQWRRNGLPVANATTGTLAVSIDKAEKAASYDVVVSNDAGASTATAYLIELSKAPAVLLTPLLPVTLLEGQRLEWNSFSVSGDDLTKQWTRVSPLPVRTGSLTGNTLVIGAASPSDSGTYTFKAFNSSSEVTSSATLRVLQKVRILAGPVASGLLTPGETAVYQVSAAGGDLSLVGGDIKYQWLRDGQVVAGANETLFRLASVSTSDNKVSLTARAYVQDPLTGVVLHSATSSPVVLAVRQPVQIVAQPEALAAELGSTAVLSVVATGSELTYQWRKNGEVISGGTQASLVLKVSETTGGAYAVTVRNSTSSVVSNVTNVDVRIPVRVTLQPVSKSINAGNKVQFRVEAAGSGPLFYQWRKDGKALVDNGTISGTRSDTLLIASADASFEGQYDVVVSNHIGNPEVSLAANLNVSNSLEIITQPVGRTLLSGGSVSLSVSAKGTTGLRYQWRRNGLSLAGATYPTLVLAKVTAAQSGDYDVVVTSGPLDVASQTAALNVYDAVSLVELPQAVTNLVPDNEAAPQAVTQLRASVSGGAAVKTWEWYRNGERISTGTGGASSVFNVTAVDAPAAYHVVVRSTVNVGGTLIDLGTATSPAVRVSLLQKVRLLNAPSGVVANNGGSASLTVSAQGGGQLAYQWERERGGRWNALAGATSETLSFAGLRSSDAGGYRVTVSNARGGVISAAAELVVREIDVILQQPVSVAANSGNAVQFEVVAAGSGLAYQWRKDGRVLPGATASRLSLPAIQGVDAGAYDVVVTHAYGTSVSNAALLTVNQAPLVTVPPSSVAVAAGNRVTLTVRATGTETLRYKWRRNGVFLAGAPDKAFLIIENAKETDAGVYDVLVENVAGSQTSGSAVVTVLSGVSIVQHPITQKSSPGQTVRFSVFANGSPMSGTGSLGYRWRKDGVALVDEPDRISGAASETLVLSLVEGASSSSPGSNGMYDVVVSNDINTAVSLGAMLTVQTAPNITTHPQSLAVNKGDTARFSVVLDERAPAVLSWFRRGAAQSSRNGVLVASGVSREYVISKVDPDKDYGIYWVVASNEYGETSSREFSLAGLDIAIPEELSVDAAGNVQRTLSASSTAVVARQVDCARGDRVALPFTAVLTEQEGVSYNFQWRLNGAAIADGLRFSGVNTKTLSLLAASDADGGVYDLLVTAVSGGVEKRQFAVRTTRVSVLQPPEVSGLADIVARPGQPVVFAPVVRPAKAGAALKFQWYVNGVLQNGITGATFTISSAAYENAGTYGFEVTDIYGTRKVEAKLSVASPLKVKPLPQLLQVETRAFTTLEVSAAGNAADGVIRYQWRFNGTPIRGAVASKLTLASVLSSNAGVYDVLVSNSFERVVSSPCEMRVSAPWSFVAQPAASTTVNPEEPVRLSFALSRTDSTSIQWFRGVGRSAQVLSGQTQSTLQLDKVQPSDDAIYFAVVTTPRGRMTTAMSRLIVNRRVVITQQPQSRTLNPASPVTFAAAAEGTGPFSYQWLRDGIPVPGATKSTLTLPSVVAADSGMYQLLVRNVVSTTGVLSNAAVLTVEAPPVILTEPADVKLLSGGTAVFSVGATGSGSLTYQWRRNGIEIPGATASAYTRQAVNAFDSGSFDCLVTKVIGTQTIGSTVSRRALLQVVDPVKIVSVPASLSAAVTGDVNRSAAFRVIASGGGPLVYTWVKLGATSASDTVLSTTGDTLSWAAVTAQDLGEYRVTVSGPVGASATVSGIRLGDARTSAFSRQPQGVTGFEGKTLTLTAQAAPGYTISKWQRVGTNATTGALKITDLSAGLNSGSLSFGTLSTADTGYYRAVAVSSGSVEVVSDSALVFVNVADPVYEAGFRDLSYNVERLKVNQTILVNEGDDVNFPLSAEGEGLVFEWSKDKSVLPATARGVGTAILNLRSVGIEDAGVYTATVKTPRGDGTFAASQSVPWTLAVRALPRVKADPLSLQTLLPGAKAVLSIAALVTKDTTFQWFFRRSGTSLWVPVPGATSGSESDSTCVLESVQKTDEGDYRVELSNAAGTVVSESGAVRVMDPVSVTLSANAFVNPGGTLTLMASTTGDLQDNHLFAFYRQSNITGRWEALKSQASGTLEISSVSESQQASYKVRAFGKVNNAVDSAPVKVIVNDPVVFAAGTATRALALAKGERAVFKVSALGSDVRYQWYFKSLASGTWTATNVTSDTYTIPAIVSEDAGAYGMRISNSFSEAPEAGKDPLEIVRLSVNTPPSVRIVSPVAGVVQSAVGASFLLQAVLSDSAAGSVNYQWRKDGRSISGASGSVLQMGSSVGISFSKAALGLLDAGYYDVVVSNSFGSTLSAGVLLVVYPNPVFKTQPDSVLGSVGGTATLRTVVTGAGTLSFSWERQILGGSWTAVERGTQPALSLRELGAADDGSLYRVRVSNEFGNVLSETATLRVSGLTDLNFETPPALVSGTASALVAGQAGVKLAALVSDKSGSTALTYRWRKDGLDVFEATAKRTVSGGSYLLSYELPTVTNDTDGVYDVTVTNGATFAGSQGVALVVDPKIDAFEVPQTIAPGNVAKLSVTVRNAASGKYDYSWYRNGTVVSDGSLFSGALTSELILKAAPATWTTDSQFKVVVRNRQTNATMESVTRALGVLAPVSITTQPQAVSLDEGTAFSLNVAASGGGELKYQWTRDGLELAGETLPRLVRGTAEAADGGLYQVRVSNAVGSVYSDLAAVNVQAKLGVSLAASDAVPLGGAVNLLARVSGIRSASDLLEYQWTLNGKVLANASSGQYRISSASLLDGGSYIVTVTRKETGEKVASNAALLEIKRVPVVVVAPVSRVVVDGANSTVNFAVVVSSDTTVSYQWSKDSVLIPNANTSSYRIAGAAVANAGQYTVRITNAAGSVETSARLSVLGAGSKLTPGVTAGSTGTIFARADWWVYWVEAAASLSSNNRNGYYLLERGTLTVGGTTTVVPGRSLWVWGSASKLMQVPVAYEWAASEQVVQDGAASDRNEFSVVADRLPAASFTLAGKLEGVGEAALYGAPEVAKGAYNGDTEPLSVSLAWDAEQVAMFQGTGSPSSLREMEEMLKESLSRELAAIAGE